YKTSPSSARRLRSARAFPCCTSSTAFAPPTRWPKSKPSATRTCVPSWTRRPSLLTVAGPCHRTTRACVAQPRTPMPTSRRARPATLNYDRLPSLVQQVMDEFARRIGRQYHLFDYHGNPQAKRVLVLMGSGVETARETVDWLGARGEKVGVLAVRLYRP